ncbi:carbohydrate ABC transporter permease [Humisphaera borealis]|uniref:Carbohydrate ABC transporter permease n=1 Tax=Humisphaera borealis TaxID=2807512 RepID=A0A7M2X0J3_9BACT|nr:carbohydrate ABC transporter permease [Humisphaera borealis]QOV90932.1 carbohydrate ABC transporter permease [Humisphaera borealis]
MIARNRRISFLLHAILLIAAAVMLVPLAWMLWAALTRPDTTGVTTANFTVLLERHPFGNWLVNSLFVSAAQTVLVVVTSSLGGFALAKYRFAGRRLVMALMLATLFLPFQVLLPSAYDLMIRLGWIDTFAAVVVPGSVSAFGTFLFMQASDAIPDELIAAARIDGCSEFRVWWEVALPILRPMTGAYTLLAFVASWNSYLWPATVLLNESRYTLAVGLANLIGLPEYESQFGVLMAATLLGLLPVVALFAWLQKEFVGGLASGAVKE